MKKFFLLIITFCLLSSSLFAKDAFIVESIGMTKNTEARKHLIERILDTRTMDFSYRALSIVIDMYQKEPRGKMQGKTITLSASVVSEGEFLKLLIHEIGHYVDIYSLAPTHAGDISDQFYHISWQTRDTKYAGETTSNFVSGYAASNQYEDFAESFTFYIFHNREFADRAQKNESLRRKYLFFSENVFPKGQFVDTDFRTGVIPSYLWDTTKIPISVKKYLNSLRE